MSRQENEQFVRELYFEKAKKRLNRLAGQFVPDKEAVIKAAAITFNRMLAKMAYVDNPDHPMAASVFSSCATLSLYLALRERGVNGHEFGCALLTYLEQSSFKPVDTGSDPKLFAEFIAAGEASQKDVPLGEYVYEAFAGNEKDFDWGVNIKRCALCRVFSQYDAMDLAPYMCAMNDVMSDMINQGLRRTGTIALGAPRCEYKYKLGGEPQRLADQYPDRIHYVRSS